jgi:hypothetical protein
MDINLDEERSRIDDMFEIHKNSGPIKNIFLSGFDLEDVNEQFKALKPLALLEKKARA